MTENKLCGATTKSKKTSKCGRPAGWGTDHPGYGNCKLHGGSTPMGVVGAARMLAVERAEVLAAAATPVKVDPGEALLMSLYSAVALTSAARARLDMVLAGGVHGVDERMAREVYEQSLDRQQSYAESCLRLGIEQRQVDIVERMGETILTLVRAVVDDLGVDIKTAQPVIARRLAAMGAVIDVG